jgi:hypothetical protein
MKTRNDEKEIEEIAVGKPFGANIRAWAIHDLFGSLKTEELKKQFRELRSGCAPALLTGQVDVDYLARWQKGSCMRSSLIVTIARGDECWRVETENTLYKLCGPGRITTQTPQAYDFEVGKTLVLIDPNCSLSPEDDSNDHIVHPDHQESLIRMFELMKVINAQNRP